MDEPTTSAKRFLFVLDDNKDVESDGRWPVLIIYVCAHYIIYYIFININLKNVQKLWIFVCGNRNLLACILLSSGTVQLINWSINWYI